MNERGAVSGDWVLETEDWGLRTEDWGRLTDVLILFLILFLFLEFFRMGKRMRMIGWRPL